MGLLSTIGAASGRAFGFTRSAIAVATDAYFNLVTLLLPGNGTNGAQNNTFLDSGTANGGVGFTITRNPSTGPNAPTQGTFSPFSQTGWSNYFGGDGGTTVKSDQISFADNAALELGSSDFCIEAWIYLTATPTTTVRICDKDAASNTSYLFYINSSRNPALNFSTNGSAVTTLTSTGTVSTNTWNHVAITRSGSTFTFWINGASSGTSTNAVTIFNGTAVLRIGNASSNDRCFPGYISNFRLTTGAPVYTIAFTPSTTPLTTTVSSGTVALLTCQSNRFIDNSANAVITVTGTPSVQAFSPFAPTAAYSAATNGGSGYFDGNGDYLSLTGNAAFALGNGDFSVEFWFYLLAEGTTASSFVGNRSGAGDTRWFMNYLVSSDKIEFSGGTTQQIQSNSLIKLNQWYHLVVTRASGVYRLFLNGVLDSTNTPTLANFSDSTTALTIGSSGTSYYTNGYITDVRIVKGTIPTTYQTSSTTTGTQIFTTPTAPLTTTSQGASGVSLLTNFTNAGITDATAKNVLETVGNAQISTTQSKFGGSSMYFDGAGDYFLMPERLNFDFGTGDFTLECWIYLAATPSTTNIIIDTRAADSLTAWSFSVSGTSKLDMIYGTARVTSTGSISTGAWTHVAATRSGSSIRLFINGTQDGSATSSSAINSANTPAIGGGRSTAGSGVTGYYLNGYIDDLRITKGYARYTANFTPPTTAFALQ